MQLAINAILFVVAFSILSDIIRFQRTINHLIKKLRSATNDFRLRKSPSKRDAVALTLRLLPTSHAELLTRDDVEVLFDENTWQGLAYHDFKSTILAKGNGMKTFPCVYATMGYRSGDHRFVFLDSDNPSEPRNVRKIALALTNYLRISTSLGPNTSLVIISAPSEKERTVEEHNRTFWDMLRGLRICDPKAWPHDIPQDTEDAKWTFCFNGEPVFPVMLTPAHQERWSRHMSVPLIALQPKWVLDKLLQTPEKRMAAQNKVRNLLQKYDTISISPDLTDYGAAGTSEIRQLCLQDKNESVQCPYHNFDS
ncbi:unnamed protein product [Fusarium venenatum]|uniref:YqcI/YcgG family protein n=1 Tax=Fusarium venenatum TaxID=56646 RepID=A0A2L2TIV1_9HYPO|nr:uncharacterized protein FVRRES_10971 [Fusarium venenatum]KAH6967537.1 YqcI/YcgG family-domain-containing protein [Fusarium venenatum]CEI70894.1 unnamed protein product [Fusarium venenatum]